MPTISDPLPQFLIAPHIFSNASNKKSSIFERDWSKFNREEFIRDYYAIDWPHIFKLQNYHGTAKIYFNQEQII